MAGGYLNIIAIGNANVLLTGNPTKTFFNAAYSKHTNFGLQKYRLDYDGTRDLRLTEESKFTFKIKKYADLLMDIFLIVNLPDIWSPIYNPTPETNYKWVGYDFKWIDDIGLQMIKSIEINCGSVTIQRYSGSYLSAMMDRDFPKEKKDLFNEMSGNIDSINDPANAFGRKNAYPSAYYSEGSSGAEPSIRGKTLMIPINAWFSLNTRCAFPLASLLYSELTVNITLRPIQELFQVRDVFDSENMYPYIQPDFNQEHFQMYRFLQTPPAIRIDTMSKAYEIKQRVWNADINLSCTYCFLSNAEIQKFAEETQVYLIKDVIQHEFNNVVGTQKLRLENSSGMVSSWMFHLQRNDVNMRNEWNNYSNWPYKNLPSNVVFAPSDIPSNINNGILDLSMQIHYGPRINPGQLRNNTGIYVSGNYSQDNQKEILLSMGIVLDGEYRENILQRGIFDYVEKYTRTNGFAKEGIYCYNFCLSTNPLNYQPSGALNMSKFKNIELEISTYTPSILPNNSSFTVICSSTGNPISVTRKPGWQLFQYSYNVTVYEERYNILSFVDGNAGMMFSR
jgi:hypothetical protein